MVTACSSKESSGGNEKDENGNYKEKLKISVASTVTLKDGAMDNEFHKFWMDKYNIEWDYNFIEWDSWGEKLRLWINSGDLPDVATWNYVHGDAMNYIDQGLLYKFPDDWKERWPNVAAAYKLTGLGDKLEELTGGTYLCLDPFITRTSLQTRSPTRLVLLQSAVTGRKQSTLKSRTFIQQVKLWSTHVWLKKRPGQSRIQACSDFLQRRRCPDQHHDAKQRALPCRVRFL